MNVVNGNTKGSSDKISINFSDKEQLISKSTVRNVKEDKISSVEIKDISSKSIDLKEVGYGEIVKEHLEKTTEISDEKKEEEKKSAEGIESRITAKDYEQLMAEGDIQEAYDVVRLDKALTRIKSQRQDRRKGIEEQAAKYEKNKEAVAQIAYNTHGHVNTQQDVGELLEEANLPVTEDNILKVATAIELSSGISNLSDKDISYMMKNNLEPTIENIYKSSYSNGVENVSPLSEEERGQLKLQIQTILSEAGYENSAENEGKAIWLIEHNLPLTKETLASLNQLYDIRDSMKELNYNEHIIDKIISSVGEGIAPEHTKLLVLSKETIQALETIRESSEDTVKIAVQLEESVTISALAKANEYIQNNNSVDLGIDDGKYITAKRQLEEIRLKMTSDAAGKMAEKGIQLDTTELSVIVEELKIIENAYYSNLLKEGNLIDSKDNILLLQEITQSLEEIKFVPSYVLGSTLEQKNVVSPTLSSIHREGITLKTQLERMNEKYETLMTEPRNDLGDSIKKAFAYTDSILAELELEATKGNQRAVRILGYNEMPITKESIQEIKTYDTMVNHLIKEMHPAVVVDMIKDGKNPLDIPLEELSQSIAHRKEELGVTEEEKYSTYLWKLEREEGISPEERKSYIGIYRLLNNVEKTDGAALGSVINAEKEITLNNLLTAVRTIKNKGMDVEVNDAYGALEELTYSRENITSQIGAGYEQHKESNIKYMESLLDNIMEDISPGKLSSVGKKNGTDQLLDLSVEKFYEELQMATEEKEISDMYHREKTEQIRETLDRIDEPLALLKNLNMPATIAHIAAAKEYLYQDTKIYRKIHDVMNWVEDDEVNESIKESMNSIVEALNNKDDISKGYEILSEKASMLIDKALENPDIRSSEIIQLKGIRQGIKLVTALSNTRNYEIPILVGDQITNVNLKIITGQGKTSKVDIKVQSENLGNIDGSFTIKGEEIKGLILCDNREGLSQLKGNQEALTDKIQDKGLTLKQLDYGSYQYNKNSSIIQDNDKGEDNSSTNKLYELAKLLIYHIKDVELQNS